MRLNSASEQVAARLREEILSGRRYGEMPGIYRLAEELQVNHKTVDAALRQLEAGGLLVAQGAGRRRKIALPEVLQERRPLRVAILLSDAVDRRLDYIVELQHGLLDAGCAALYAPKTLSDLGMEAGRIAGLVENTEADAWVVVGGSREILEWFAGRESPSLALFGRRRGLRMAGVGPDKPPAIAEATRVLIGLGHRRIVLLARPRRRLPEPGASEQAFLDVLAAHGIVSGAYHLPDWEESIEGFHSRLDSLFRLTPPTALIIDEAPLFVAAQQFLAGRRRVPDDVSLVCTDADPAFEWCRPAISHIRWDSGPVVRRIVRWAANVSRRRKDLRQTLTPVEFVRGGTMGVAAR